MGGRVLRFGNADGGPDTSKKKAGRERGLKKKGGSSNKKSDFQGTSRLKKKQKIGEAKSWRGVSGGGVDRIASKALGLKWGGQFGREVGVFNKPVRCAKRKGVVSALNKTQKKPSRQPSRPIPEIIIETTSLYNLSRGRPWPGRGEEGGRGGRAPAERTTSKKSQNLL